MILYDENSVELIRQTLMVTLKIAVPLLTAGMIIGLLISLVQSITSIQDQTLTFVPKIVGVILIAILLLPWIIGSILVFTAEMLQLF
ncbi:MAG: EscS/YscS/HrcS family type III secretion system export apparatus protein [Phycisphaerae bacterium]|nr:EscS/YscS/HrcS family type III secretion system export apparatus protein [Phycisphaerae bacterium]MBM92471.1 EscS/YscS/HrcS family type III secretion system export apparatus protein [Phycisphaerae bacterium]|tara:strand:- start:50 stop:310 length:261 start_codon:yes stop_codon:yes gene_type:complete